MLPRRPVAVAWAAGGSCHTVAVAMAVCGSFRGGPWRLPWQPVAAAGAARGSCSGSPWQLPGPVVVAAVGARGSCRGCWGKIPGSCHGSLWRPQWQPVAVAVAVAARGSCRSCCRRSCRGSRWQLPGPLEVTAPTAWGSCRSCRRRSCRGSLWRLAWRLAAVAAAFAVAVRGHLIGCTRYIDVTDACGQLLPQLPWQPDAVAVEAMDGCRGSSRKLPRHPFAAAEAAQAFAAAARGSCQGC